MEWNGIEWSGIQWSGVADLVIAGLFIPRLLALLLALARVQRGYVGDASGLVGWRISTYVVVVLVRDGYLRPCSQAAVQKAHRRGIAMSALQSDGPAKQIWHGEWHAWRSEQVTGG